MPVLRGRDVGRRGVDQRGSLIVRAESSGNGGSVGEALILVTPFELGTEKGRGSTRTLGLFALQMRQWRTIHLACGSNHALYPAGFDPHPRASRQLIGPKGADLPVSDNLPMQWGIRVTRSGNF